MRKLVLLALSMAVVLVLVMAGSFVMFINTRASPGFELSSLRSPSMVFDSPVERIQHTNSSVNVPPLRLQMSWTVTPIYAGYGGVMNVTVKNNDPTTVYVYGYGVVWEHSTVSTSRNASVLIPAGANRTIGLLFFQAPDGVPYGYYTITLNVEIQNMLGTGWSDIGSYGMTDSKYASFETPLDYLDHSTTSNNPGYYSKVNERIDMGATRSSPTTSWQTIPTSTASRRWRTRSIGCATTSFIRTIRTTIGNRPARRCPGVPGTARITLSC